MQYAIQNLPGASLILPDTIAAPPVFPNVFREDFDNGLGHWGSSGMNVSVSNGILRSHTWSIDDNHTQAKGGAGRIFLLAYADKPYWSYQKSDGTWVLSNLTNARIRARVRGDNFTPGVTQVIAWIQARNPDMHPVEKYVNYGFVGQPLTSKLSGGWQEIDIILDPDGDWVWGKGNAPLYDSHLPVSRALQYVSNFHIVALGNDGCAAPTGAFEMDWFEATYNRNGPPLSAPPTSNVGWDPACKASQVTLSANRLTATHGTFGPTSGVRTNISVAAGMFYGEKLIVSNPDANTRGVGFCKTEHNPAIHGGTYPFNSTHGFGLDLGSGALRRAGVVVGGYGAPIVTGDVVRWAAVTNQNGEWHFFFGKNGGWFGGATDAEIAALNTSHSANTFAGWPAITGAIHLCDGNGTGASGFQATDNFGAAAFAFAPPNGLTSLEDA